jgi:putative membrane protein insertion efficiency factor
MAGLLNVRVFFMNPANFFLRVLIRAYQIFVSPFLPAHCRYWPTCSVYAMKAVREHGALSGGWLAARRVGRCHPWGGSGYDPVPEIQGRAATNDEDAAATSRLDQHA